MREGNGMTDGLGTDSAAAAGNHQAESTPVQPAAGGSFWRTLAFVAAVLLSAGIAFAIVRSLMRKPPPDPTSDRIQSLIDEANRLLKTLDDQKRA